MGIFNITNNKIGIITLPLNGFQISTLTGSGCPPIVNQTIDNVAYHNGGARDLILGDIVYSDEELTTLYNTTGLEKDYDCIIDGVNTQIRLDNNSIYVAIVCK